MRVLFVGQYDIAGQYLATRLYKEGHSVSWLTEEPEKILWGESVKGNIYRYAINYQNCSQIIRTDSSNLIVFLTQDYRELCSFREGDMINLQNYEIDVLRAAVNFEVKNIVYISSSDLWNEDILNPAMEKMRSTERICQSVCKHNNMKCIIARTGIVYGEIRYANEGMIGKLIGDIAEGKKISVDFSDNSEFDLVYGSDFADACERLIAMEADGVFDILSGDLVAVSDIINRIKEGFGYKLRVEYGLKNHIVAADEITFRNYTGWMPFFEFDKVIDKLLRDYRYVTDNEKKEKSSKRKRGHSKGFAKELLQNLVLFAFFTVINVFSKDWSDIRFVDVKLLYVVIVAISFGMRQGLVATLMASIAYVVKLYTAQVDLSYIAYSIDTWVPFIVYGLGGAVVGYISDKHNDELYNQEEEYDNLNKKYEFLKNMYQEVINIKNQLQKQILISKDSLGYIYEITEEMDDTRPRTVYFKAVNVIEKTMETSSVAIYQNGGEGTFARLVACSAGVENERKQSVDLRNYPEMYECFKKNQLFVNTQLIQDYPGFAMPVTENDKIVCIICIYNLDIDKYTVYYKNLFKTLIHIIRSCLIRAYNYQNSFRDKLYINNLEVLNEEAFLSECDAIALASETLMCPFSIGVAVSEKKMTIMETLKKVDELSRTTDIVGLMNDGTIKVNFVYVSKELREYAKNRYESAGIKIIWEE